MLQDHGQEDGKRRMMEWLLPISWGIIGILVLVIAYIIRNPEKVEGLVALLSRIPASWNLKYDKTFVASDIQSKLNTFAKSVNSENVEIMPYPAKIEWVRSIDRQVLIKENEIVIKLDGHAEQPKNLVHAAIAYVSKGLLPFSRTYVDDRIMKSCDLVVTSKILRQDRKKEPLDLFFKEFLQPIVEHDNEMKRNISIVMKLDDAGYFDAILLRELWELGRKLYPKETSDAIKQESKELLKILERLVEKKKGEDINTTLQKKNISMTVVLVGRPEVVASYGIDPYVNWIDKCLDNGIRTIHILARGKMNITVARLIAEHFSKSMKIEKMEEERITAKELPEVVHILFKERIA
jgi:hypothetical protein